LRTCWLLLLEEYGVTFDYLPEKKQKNVVAGALFENTSDRVLRTCWLLLLEEYGVTFDYLPEKKQKNVVAGALLRLDIYSLKIQEEEVLTLLSGSENNSISYINIPNAYCLDLHRASKSQGNRIERKGLSLTS
jgi:hypothetical protein